MPFRPSPTLDAARPAPHALARAALPERTERMAALLLQAPAARLCLHAPAARDEGAAGGRGASACGGDGAWALFDEVLARRAAVVVDDAATLGAPLADALGAHGWRAALAVPLHARDGRLLGVLAVADVAPRAWRDEETLLLTDLAALAADACDGLAEESHRWVRTVAQREAHEARRKSEHWLALAFNSTADLTVLLDVEDAREGRCVAVNDAYLAVTGLDEGAVVGRSLAAVWPSDGPAAARLDEVRCGGEPAHCEETLELPVGTLHVETTLTPIADARGRCAYVLVVARDVSARRRAERELREARDAAERASQAKTDFLSRMSHELRTPLNSVIGFANVLRTNRDGHLDERELTFVDRIATNGRHLLSLISDLLDIARIEAGRMPLAPCPVPLGPLVRTTLALFEPEVAGRPVALVADVPAELARLDADPTRLQQVLVNLVTNALRHTARGTVTVRVVADPDTGRARRIEVADTGIGIAPSRHDRIFEAFGQGDERTAEPHVGSGLGLAVSRSLCQLMGFTLAVSSAPGAGATFTIGLEG